MIRNIVIQFNRAISENTVLTVIVRPIEIRIYLFTNLIGSHLIGSLSIGQTDTEMSSLLTRFCFLLLKTNRFHVVMHLFLQQIT